MRFVFNRSSDHQGTPTQVGMDYEEVWFESLDGVRLHGWLVPNAKSSGPLVLYLHGNAANITHRVPNLEFIHRLGLSVFIFDYRGFGMSEGRPLTEEDLYQDARGAIGWLKQRGWTNDNLIFYGRSMGAAVALQMALENPPAGVVLESPFTSLTGIARERAPTLYAIWGWWSIGDSFDNLGKISKLRRPLLIVHGEQDQVIPYEMSLELFEKANEPKMFALIAGARHSDSFQANEVDYSSAWKNFITQLPTQKSYEK